MKNQIKIHEGLNSLIDQKYENVPAKVKELLKTKVQEKVDEKFAQGIDVSIHVYDKKAQSQARVQYMNREPENFKILNIDIKNLFISKTNSASLNC